MADNDVGDEIAQLRDEVARLRSLVGPSESSYLKLQLDVLGARDAAKAAEAEVGVERGRIQLLETELDRALRDFAWMREQVVGRSKAMRDRGRRGFGVIGRLTSR